MLNAAAAANPPDQYGLEPAPQRFYPGVMPFDRAKNEKRQQRHSHRNPQRVQNILH